MDFEYLRLSLLLDFEYVVSLSCWILSTSFSLSCWTLKHGEALIIGIDLRERGSGDVVREREGEREGGKEASAGCRSS